MQTQQPTTKTKSIMGHLFMGMLLMALSIWSDNARAASSYYTVCQNLQVAITSSGGTGGWAAHNGNPGTSGIMSPTNSTATVYNFSVAGVYAYIWTGSGGNDTAYVTVNAIPAAAVAGGTVTCYGASTGSICVVASGGAGGYSYAWTSGGGTTSCINSMAAGTYYVSVTDANGCIGTGSGTISQPASAFTVTATHTDVQCNGTSTGTITLTEVGGTAPYGAVSWSGGLSGTNPVNVPAGTYSYMTSDANGCQASGNVTIGEPTPMVVTATVVNVSAMGANDGSIAVTVTGGTPPYTYLWNNGATTQTVATLAAGSYYLTVMDAAGCTHLDTVQVLPCTICVWPGDADANLLVDNNDLLPIGLGYDSTGPARAVTSIVWQGNTATDWAQAFASYTPAVNYKYADCNGDGVIDAIDTMAITQNFSLTHSKTIIRKPWRAGDPVIYPLLSKDTVTNGDTLTIDIHLGDVSLAATNVYGLAYTINYDPAVFDTTKTTFVYGNSWLGSSADMIAISKDITAQGVIKTAVTRIDHTTRSGAGVIAHMRAIVTTDNIDGKDLSYYPVQIIISDVRAIDQSGTILQVNEGADSTDVAYTPLGLHDMAAGAGIAIYPNPASGILHITSAHTAVQVAEVVNTLGEIVGSYTWTDTLSDHTADMSSLGAGIYYIRLHTRAGMALRKLTVVH